MAQLNTSALNPRILQPGDIDPNWRWDKHIPAWGHTSVDFEKRVDHDRLRRYRLSRSKDALKNSGCGALLMFDVNNIRYVSGTKIGEWERDKMCRFCLLTGMMHPTFGISGRRPCTTGNTATGWIRPLPAGVVGMRGTIPPASG